MAKILLVDDEPEIVLLTKMMLEEEEGHEIIVAKNSKECFECLKTMRPDLILMDIMMPGEDGWEACKRLKEDEKTKGIPVAMFTVRTSQESIDKSLNYAHAGAQINKPFKRQDLIGTIDNLTNSEKKK